MCETKLKLQIVLVVLCIVVKGLHGFDDSLLFTVTRAPRYFGILQDHRGQPLSVEASEEYMDQDYIATNSYWIHTYAVSGSHDTGYPSVGPEAIKRHKMNWNKNPLEADDFDDDETDEMFDYKDKDVKMPGKLNKLQAGPV